MRIDGQKSSPQGLKADWFLTMVVRAKKAAEKLAVE
jgi:hypothetical protein